MRKVLYKDKFVEVYGDEIVIKTYFFPIATSKHISVNDIRCVYYRKQQGWEDFCVTKGWGMTLYPVWWACDLRRQIQTGKTQTHYNVILDNGTFVKPGFTVVDIHKFLRALRPLMNAPFENRFPNSFEHRVQPPPTEYSSMEKLIENEEKSERMEVEEEEDENLLKQRKINEKMFSNELPPSYDEAISSTKSKPV